MCGLTAAGETLQFVIVELKTGWTIGSCLIFRYDKQSARAEIDYVMRRTHWKQGYTHEAISALISHAFKVYKLRRLEAEVDPANIASNNLLTKLGFSCEGCLRQHWYAQDGNYDTNIYGLLRDKWLAKRGIA
jgi:RimJ/RimL family protein N-acetyltransferase